MDGQRREQRRASLMGTGDPPSLPELETHHTDITSQVHKLHLTPSILHIRLS